VNSQYLEFHVESTTAVVTPEPLTLGQQLAAKRHSPQTYARSIARSWPALTEESRAEIAGILAPIVAELAEKAGK
jgi:hypothetical protein